MERHARLSLETRDKAIKCLLFAGEIDHKELWFPGKFIIHCLEIKLLKITPSSRVDVSNYELLE